MKWQCLDCGEVWECESQIIFSYCPECKGGWCKPLGVRYFTYDQIKALDNIAGPKPAYDFAQRQEHERTARERQS